MHTIIIHGSEDSLDTDAYIIIKEKVSIEEAKSICNSFSDVNANLLVVEDGIVTWCFKGTVDECNNSIISTYGHHSQTHDNPIERKLDRSFALKLVRTVRGLLTYHSKTDKRKLIKAALKSEDLILKIETLKSINLADVDDFHKNTLTEVYKFFAFQIGQTYALLKDNVELFTKNEVASHYPKLAPYLKRVDGYPVDDLQDMWNEFNGYLLETVTRVEKHDWFATKYNGLKEVVDVKNEKIMPRVVVFDIDNTLMDETHRESHRINKDWDTYFDLCHLDKPIKHVIKLTHEYHEKGYEVWVMSGRSERILDKTIKSLKDNGVYFDHIKLRSLENRMPDFVVKPAWAKKHIGLDRIDFVYDDLDRVIEGFRKYGLNTIDVKQMHKKHEKLKRP